MQIATWNVNSVNARLETVLAWFREANPDVACLQELKCVDEKFPYEAFEALGYNIAVHGQKTYNGVALLSKYPLEDVRKGLPGDESDEQARYVEAVIGAPRPIRIASLYLPNGNPIGTEKFAYKLDEAFVLAGDYNVIPEPEDADQPEGWLGDALFQPESRAAWRAIKYLGLTEAQAEVAEDPHAYTFWDYQAGAWQRNHGIRIDHQFLSPLAAERLTACVVHRDARGMDKPSDHVPVVTTLTD